MRSTITLSVPDQLHARQLRALRAWWCLGSSALEPQSLMPYAPGPLAGLREAGL